MDDRERLSRAADAMWGGRSISWVAREYGYTNVQMGYLAGILGLSNQRRSPGPKSLPKYDRVEKALEEGWPMGEVCKTLDVDRWTVERWFPDREKMSPQEAGHLAELYRKNREARERARKNGW